MLKNRKYLAESFAAFKDSKKKKEDPFAKDEETDEVDQTEDTDDKDITESDEDKDDATEEEIEEAEEDDELEAEMAESDDEDEEEDEEEDEDSEDGELEDIDGDGDVDEDDVEIAEDESDEDAEEESENDTPAQQGFGASANTDMSSMMSGGMNGMTSFKRPEWAITRVMTDNGERIAMEYQTETECEVIVGNLTYTEADARSTEIANQLNLSAFNSETDKYLGRVSSKVVRKQEEEKKTSYKY